MTPERQREVWREASRKYRATHLERVRANERASAKRNYKKNKPRIKAHNKLRRARQKGAPSSEVVLPLIVALRDRWHCHLCGGWVSKATWSLDHLLPLTKGGDHTYANIKLAHRSCNVRRGNTLIDYQLNLF